MSLRTIWPLICVTDMERSLAFYRDGLGFEIVASWEGPHGIAWCRLKRGPVSLMIQIAEGEVPPPVEGQAAELYILCDDARALHAEFVARGIQASEPQTHGLRHAPIPSHRPRRLPPLVRKPGVVLGRCSAGWRAQLSGRARRQTATSPPPVNRYNVPSGGAAAC